MVLGAMVLPVLREPRQLPRHSRATSSRPCIGLTLLFGTIADEFSAGGREPAGNPGGRLLLSRPRVPTIMPSRPVSPPARATPSRTHPMTRRRENRPTSTAVAHPPTGRPACSASCRSSATAPRPASALLKRLKSTSAASTATWNCCASLGIESSVRRPSYCLDGELDDALARLPFPDPGLSLRKTRCNSRSGSTDAHRKLRSGSIEIAHVGPPRRENHVRSSQSALHALRFASVTFEEQSRPFPPARRPRPCAPSIVIPARYASTAARQAAAAETGKYLIQHVYEQACEAKLVVRRDRRHRRPAHSCRRRELRRHGRDDPRRTTRPAPTASPRSPPGSTPTWSSTCRATSR